MATAATEIPGLETATATAETVPEMAMAATAATAAAMAAGTAADRMLLSDA
jgi:hypothetical protein